MTTTWVLLLFMSSFTAGVGTAKVVTPIQPTVIGGYASEETCKDAMQVAISRFKTEWRAVWGDCIPGPRP
jgi:hypothetical protein